MCFYAYGQYIDRRVELHPHPHESAVRHDGVDKGGRALFKVEPKLFNAMPRVHQADALELVKGIPVAVKLIIAYYPDREDSSSAPSTFAIIPSD